MADCVVANVLAKELDDNFSGYQLCDTPIFTLKHQTLSSEPYRLELQDTSLFATETQGSFNCICLDASNQRVFWLAKDGCIYAAASSCLEVSFLVRLVGV
jgi:hypothetical protein